MSTIKYHFLFYLILIGGQCLGQNTHYRIEPIPEWVKQQSPNYDKDAKNKSVFSGYHYLLVNKQENIASEQIFTNYSIKIDNTEGLQNISDISIDFDPNFQKLVFHRINVIRKTKIINHLDEASIKILQRETSMERHIYDGRLTIVINLKDIRIGDIIDYSYSIIGYNPVFKGHYSNKIYLQYSVPVNHIFILLIAPNEKKLDFKYNNGAFKPNYYSSKTSKIYTWEQKNVPLLLYDINTPSWYDPYPSVAISDYSSWGNVVNWAKELFTISKSEKKQLQESIAGLISHKSIDSTIIRAIRFTQDEIRYLGFVNGLNSHKPHSPLKVLDQRYGDCKDKSFLLSEILKIYGLDSSPVLVHSTRGFSLDNNVPSPDIFDHCVVQFKKDNNTYFIDPTISNQGGDLDHYYFPNYKKGLIIKEGENSLTDLPLSNSFGVKVKEIITIEDIGKSGNLYISTTYTGADADLQREYITSNNLESIQKAYINFYSLLYPHIRLNDKIRIEDHRDGNNIVKIEEFYTIDSLWIQPEENEQLLQCEIYPLILENYISVSQSPNRTMPYHVNYPSDFEQETIIKLPEEWNFDNTTLEIENESFIYLNTVVYDEKTIKIVHKYKTLQEYVIVDKVDSFVKGHKKILQNLPYFLTYNPSLAGKQFAFSWLAGFLMLLILIFYIYFAVKIYNNYDLQISTIPNEQREIGGWLILVAIGLTFSPLTIFYEIYTTPSFINNNVWKSLLNYEDLLTAILFAVEIIYNLLYLVFSLLIVFLFYKRRTILPRFAIILYSSTLLFLIIDTIAAIQINPLAFTSTEKQIFNKEIVSAFISAAIWIPYFIFSKRVKQTFVKISKKNMSSAKFENRKLKTYPTNMQSSFQIRQKRFQEKIKCPKCNILLELSEEEQINGKFICPNCDEKITEKDM